MKRLALAYELTSCLFKDLEAMGVYSRRSDLERDQSRLKHELGIRGIRVYTIDLPPLCKHFDKCLAEGSYTRSGLYLSKARKGEQVPVFLRDLFLRVFTPSGELLPEPSPNSILAIRQVYKFLSKLKELCPEKERIDEARNFIEIEESLPHPTMDWGGIDSWGDRPEFHRISVRDFTTAGLSHERGLFSKGQISDPLARRMGEDLTYLQTIADIVAQSLGYFDPEELLNKHFLEKEVDFRYCSHGTGRVSDQGRNDTKYVFPSWPDKTDVVFPFDKFGIVNMRNFPMEQPSEYEGTSKLIAVPKTMKGPRLIASEPTHGMWTQQIIWRWLEERVANTPLRGCIDFSSQRNNSDLALSSSKTQSHSTIDLSSASDRVSLYLIERIFRKNTRFLEAIRASRTQVIRNEISPWDWKYIHLRKAFSQGNACTFPVQSIVFAIISMASVGIQRGIPARAHNLQKLAHAVCVFGDDIIVPKDSFECTVKLLTTLGLEVNSSKTFHKGHFRESCGTDAYAGVNVTPTYVKVLDELTTPKQVSSAIDCANNLFANGWWHLASQLDTMLKRYRKYLPIIGPDSGRVGLKSFSGRYSGHLRSRWNKHLHKRESFSLQVSNRTPKRKTHSISDAFQYFTEKPKQSTKWSSGTVRKPSLVIKKVWV